MNLAMFNSEVFWSGVTLGMLIMMLVAAHSAYTHAKTLCRVGDAGGYEKILGVWYVIRRSRTDAEIEDEFEKLYSDLPPEEYETAFSFYLAGRRSN
jgi:hypothetical protein